MPQWVVDLLSARRTCECYVQSGTVHPPFGLCEWVPVVREEVQGPVEGRLREELQGRTVRDHE